MINLRHNAWKWFRWAVATVLLFSAMAKGYELTILRLEPAVRIFWILVIELQWLLVVLLISRAYDRITVPVTIAIFSVFSLATGYKLVTGETDCGCFGVFTVHPGITLLLDISILMGLIAFRPQHNERYPMKLSDNTVATICIFMLVAVPGAWLMASPSLGDPPPPQDANQGQLHANEQTELTELPEQTLSGTESPQREQSKLVHNFGYVEPGSVHQVRYIVVNEGDRPLNIKSIKSECSCTTIKSTPQIIAPGEAAHIDAVFDAFDRVMNYKKHIHVTTDDSVNPRITLTLLARIGLPLSVTPDPLKVSLVGQDASATIEQVITIYNDGKEPVKLLYATSRIKGCVVSIPRDPIPANGYITLPVQFTGGHESNKPLLGEISIRTTCKDQLNLSVKVELVNESVTEPNRGSTETSQ